MKKGIWFAVAAYSCWGLFPLYWKLLRHIPALQLIGHRIVWSFVFMIAAVVLMSQWKAFRGSVLAWRVLGLYSLASLLIGVNWLTYIWAVNSGHVVEASLGYFINPLLSVLMGVLFFRERLRLWQWVSIGLAMAGVLYLTFAFGVLPWIALTLAFSFALYGLVKKVAPLSSLHGLLLETTLLLAPAIAYLVFEDRGGNGAFLHSSLWIDMLLIVGGLITTIPLLLFASAARRIPLTVIGILQFIAPTLQFILGIALYREPFSRHQFWGYSIVWIALTLFCVEGYWVYSKQRLAEVKELLTEEVQKV
jgi:chloramphenicol-sensitive protein RarD